MSPMPPETALKEANGEIDEMIVVSRIHANKLMINPYHEIYAIQIKRTVNRQR